MFSHRPARRTAQWLIIIAIAAFSCLFLKIQIANTSSDNGSAHRSRLTWNSPRNATTLDQVKKNAGSLPTRFELNQGQAGRQAKYFVRSSGYVAFFAPAEIVLSLSKRVVSPRASKAHQSPIKSATLRMQLAKTNKDVQIVGEEQLPGTTNYYIGDDPKKWRTNVPSFSRVRYKELYDGIDMVNYSSANELEYDFVVNPGGHPDVIEMKFRGIDDVSVDRDGDLVFKTAVGVLRHSKPYVYQNVNGIRKEIPSRFTLRANGVGFEIGNYDRSRVLTIDPALTYSTFLGGTGMDTGASIAVDSSGNAYLTGATASVDFPQVNATRTRAGDADCFLSKLNPAGTALIFSTYFGGQVADRANGVALDSAGNAYVTGATSSSDFPVAGTPYQASLRGHTDAFFSKFSASGTLLYSSFLGGDSQASGETGNSIAVDSLGQMYIAGTTDSSNFPLQSATQSTIGGSWDAFVTKLNAAGTTLIYSTYLGGNNTDQASSLAIDASGNAYVTGTTGSSTFPTTAGVVKTTNSSGTDDAFVTKFSGSGSRIYSTYFGGNPASDSAGGIAVDSVGNVYLVGSTSGQGFPTVNAAQPTQGDLFFGDAFVAKLNSTATSILYSTFLGGSGSDYGRSIALDSSTNAYVTGVSSSTNFPTVNSIMPAWSGGVDAFVTKIGPAGNTFGFSSYLGGQASDQGNAIALDSSGNIYILGGTT
ncbi:MAG TPA: SBBP repeat-containing protein, partial [Pyrinomonadaceae bacterium]